MCLVSQSPSSAADVAVQTRCARRDKGPSGLCDELRRILDCKSAASEITVRLGWALRTRPIDMETSIRRRGVFAFLQLRPCGDYYHDHSRLGELPNPVPGAE